MIGVQVQTDAASIAVGLRAIPSAISGGLPTTLEKIGAGLQQYVASEKLSGGGILEPRTGNLRRSLFHRVTEAAVEVGFDLDLAPYGRVQELGGTITPKQSANLAIPIGEALTGKGVARFTAREVIANPFQFGYSGTFTAKGVIFGVIGKGKDAQLDPLFALKPSVTLEAREPLASTLETRTDWIIEQFSALIDRAIGGVGGG